MKFSFTLGAGGVELPYNKMIDDVLNLNEEVIITRVYSRTLDAISTEKVDLGLKLLSLFRFSSEQYARFMLLAVRNCDNGKEIRVVKMLLDQGVPVDTVLHDGASAMLNAAAVSSESLNLVQFLLERGANVYLQTKNSNSVLHFAASKNAEVIRLLCKSGAILNARNLSGYTPLMLATRCGTLDAMKVLVEAGAKVDEPDNIGQTPLMFAAMTAANNMEKFTYLVDQSTNLDLQDNDGWTCLYYAVNHVKCEECPKAVRLLLERGASPHIQNRKNYSLFGYAFHTKASLEVIIDLIRYSGNIRFAIHKENSAIDWALHYQANLSVIMCLTNAGVCFHPKIYIPRDPEITAYLKRYPLHHLRALCSHLRSEMADFASGEAARPLLPKAVVFRDDALPLDNLFLLPYVHVLDGVTRFREDCAREEFYQVEPHEMDAAVEDVCRTLKALARVVEMNELVRSQLLSECAEHNAGVLVRITDGEPNAKRARIENTCSE